ncbi:hypothetical protein SBF1_50073 [Candidatus Desulfosporosinus infrequens]|uniref:Uncharacterized protein n=1 Tax=Candidatus Desulfosporosinus infrequens TaxID=2043169 RepID=A0A2U3LHA1_9FIRM|nr:hypothetical protein SBF1_50073 [Candidatus Desulfosporosinus infrequens]
MLKTGELYTLALNNPEAITPYKRMKNGEIYFFNSFKRLQRQGSTDEPTQLLFDEDWEPVPQEVTWQEALSAWIEGKTVIVTLSGNDKSTYRGRDTDNQCLQDNERTWTVTRQKLKYGKWFIE